MNLQLSNQIFTMARAKTSIQTRLPDSIIDMGLEGFLPIGVQKSYFMLTEPERNLLNFALTKYRAGQTEPISVGGQKFLKPAWRLAVTYRLVIEEMGELTPKGFGYCACGNK